MKENIIIEFTYEEIKNIIMNFYGIEADDFDINDYSDEQIKEALIEGSAY